MSRKKTVIFLMFFLTTFSPSFSAIQLDKKCVEQIFTAPAKNLWPNAITFFATQVAVTTMPCWLYGGRSSGIIAGVYGILSSFLTIALLKKTEHSLVEYKIAAACVGPALLACYAWLDSEKAWVPPVMFFIGTLPVCAALAAVHYGCR